LPAQVCSQNPQTRSEDTRTTVRTWVCWSYHPWQRVWSWDFRVSAHVPVGSRMQDSSNAELHRHADIECRQRFRSMLPTTKGTVAALGVEASTANGGHATNCAVWSSGIERARSIRARIHNLGAFVPAVMPRLGDVARWQIYAD